MGASSLKAYPTLFVTVGIPGAGKSTWANSIMHDSTRIVSLDGLRRSVYGFFPQILDEVKERRVWDLALESAANYLNRGENVLIDSMALTKDFRRSISDRLEKMTSTAFKKVAIFFDTPLELALERNRTRDKTVNEDTILRLSSALEIPSRDEGFEAVVVARPDSVFST